MVYIPLRQTVPVLLAIAFLSGCKKQEMENPLLAPPAVQVAPVTLGDVPVEREWIGTLDGSSNADIRARVSGYILSQNYEDGRSVKKGDLLFQIDPRPFEAALAEAEAALAQAQADQVRAQLNADRYIKTYASGASSEADRDNYVQQNEAAKAKVKAEEANLVQARLNLEFTRVTAPFDGVISIAGRNIGDLVGPTDPTPLATLSKLDPIRVYFQVSEQTYLKGVSRFAGANREEGLAVPISMRLADGSDYPHPGSFVAVDREVQDTTGTIRIAVAFPNPGNRLRPGQFARVRLVTHLLKDAALIPQQAITELQGSHQVAVVNPENEVSIRLIRTGPAFGAYRVVSEGLKEGEEVVVEGVQKVSEGKVVVPSPYPLPPLPESGASPPAKADGVPAAGAAPAAEAAAAAEAAPTPEAVQK